MTSVASSADIKPTTVNSKRLRFGSDPKQGLLTQGLAHLESKPLMELVFKDIAAFNIPKIALARTWKERWDTATLELSNTSITLFSSLILPALLRMPMNKLVGISAGENLGKKIPFQEAKKITTKVQMARLGTAFGFFFPFATAFWAAPFFRNWLTAKRTQSSSFESMIGFNGSGGKQPQRNLREEMAYQKNTAWKVMGSGIALGVASFLGFGFLARDLGKKQADKFFPKLEQSLKNSKLWQSFFHNYDLKGESANQIAPGGATLIFWGLPAYAGWVHAARSNHERRERVLQSINALFWFFAAPKVVAPLWHKPFAKLAGKASQWKQTFQSNVCEKLKPSAAEFEEKFKNKASSLTYEQIQNDFIGSKADKEALIRWKNLKFALNDLGIPIASLSLVQWINFRLTERKIKAGQPQPIPSAPTPEAPMQPARFASSSLLAEKQFARPGVYAPYAYLNSAFNSASHPQ